MRVWPLVAVLSLVGSVSVIVMSGDDLIERFGLVTGWSVALFLLTIAFAVASVASAGLDRACSCRRSASRRAPVFRGHHYWAAHRRNLPRVLGHDRAAYVGLTVEVSDYAQYKKAPTFAGG